MQQFFSFNDIIFFELITEPLVNLVLRLRTFDNRQPVTAWSLGILGCQDLDSVAILDLIINVNKFSVDSGSYHLVTYCRMNCISEINRRGSCRQVLYISIWCKTVNTVGKKIQVTLNGRQEVFVIVHVMLPLQNAAQPRHLFLLALVVL